MLLAFALGITGCSEASDTDPDQTKLENTIKTEQGQNNSTSPNSTEGENETDPEAPNQTEAQTAEKPPIENEQVINGNMVYSYNGHWYGIQLYAGGYNQDLYIKSVNAFADDLEGVAQVYSMVAPTNADFYCPEDYSDYNASQIEDISYIEKSLSSKVKSVNCYDVIKEHIDEYLYFRTDHHWTSDGAYYAAQQFAKAAGVPFKELNDTNYEKKVIEGFVGSLSRSLR